jgi:hypothetical protein
MHYCVLALVWGQITTVHAHARQATYMSWMGYLTTADNGMAHLVIFIHGLYI